MATACPACVGLPPYGRLATFFDGDFSAVAAQGALLRGASCVVGMHPDEARRAEPSRGARGRELAFAHFWVEMGYFTGGKSAIP